MSISKNIITQNDMDPDIEDLKDIFGMKPKEKLTPEQEFGKKLLELAKQHPVKKRKHD